ncbi:tRNA 2-thiouridine(34) synthase MnmA [Marichromatium gracile]|uniref:tRNA-specific 2-thiouridylase MnmA n=1 Tax=Marichromatium gracile TaxID=1048 RepID=A0A4R4A9S0_MARGR|nr:tRNA 2-thiouridine(34) synthase MnmA [Marichromatium gracile]MBK1708803.1 tRNA 2-thiouridine(34) synthase MnmA [Marichromatium gracile]TCW35484.1 tRNA (5-methylaminomethyl-2-thiouridylate)-methyltransferase [Marichromatium gracile]
MTVRAARSRPERIIIGLSGGVDSAVAAHRLLEQGHQVEALFMKNWEEDDDPHGGYCAAAEDLADARAVAERLGIRLHTVNFATEYWDRVFEHFLAEYRALRTPNPDILCNREIKFAAFLEHALDLGAEAIATGHYARVEHGASGHRLCLCADANKDQTYFLHLLDQHQLAHTRFPLHDLSKPEVRAIARRLGLANAAKKDSTGICFIGERRFGEFLARYVDRTPGPIETPEGQVLGEHHGLAYYTIGQRQGLGIGGIAGGDEAPWFVAAKDQEHNRLIVVQGKHHPLLMAGSLHAQPPHWIAGEPPAAAPFDCLARLRHRQPLQRCTVETLGPEGCRVRFAAPQRAVTPGQSIVFYQGEACLGGAVVEHAAP